MNKLNILDQGEFSFFLLYEEEKTEEEFFGGFSYMAPCLQNDKTDAEDSISSIEKFTILYSSTVRFSQTAHKFVAIKFW